MPHHELDRHAAEIARLDTLHAEAEREWLAAQFRQGWSCQNWSWEWRLPTLLYNIIEIRGIRQWQSLELTLDETRAFLEAQQVAGMLIQSWGGGMATVTTDMEKPSPEKMQELRATTLARIREANARLGEKYGSLGRRGRWRDH